MAKISEVYFSALCFSKFASKFGVKRRRPQADNLVYIYIASGVGLY